MEDVNVVNVDTLKDHFTEQELQAVMPKEEQTQETTTTDNSQVGNENKDDSQEIIDQQEETTTEKETSQTDGETVSKLKPSVVAYDRFKEINDKYKMAAAELAAFKAAQQSIQQPAPQQAQQQQAPAQQPQQQQSSVAEQIAKRADEKVRADLNITEDIETLQYTDPKKYLQYVKNVAKEEFRLESQYEKQTELYNQNMSFVNELKTQQDFPVLYQFALNELDELPGKKARVIGAAFERIDKGIGTKEDIATAREFTAECRAKMTGITQSPSHGAIVTPANTPTTSPLDKAAGLPRATNLSGAKTSAMSWSQVEDLIRQGNIDQIPKEMLAQIDKRLIE